MYIARMAGHTIKPGIEIEINGMDDFKFEVLKVLEHSFKVKWLIGDHAGSEDIIPHSLFAGIGQDVEVIEMHDDANNPNRSFLTKKLGL